MDIYTDHRLTQHILKYEAWPIAIGVNTALETESEDKLLEYFKTGSPAQKEDAFHIFYNRFYLDIWKYIRKCMNSVEDAQDIFLESWITAKNKLPTFEWKGKSIKRWLISIAKVHIKKLYSQQAKSTCVDINDVNAIALSYIDEKLNPEQFFPSQNRPSFNSREALLLILKTAKTHLSSKNYKIITLTYIKNKNSKEVAEILGIRAGTVRVALTRARTKIQELLEKEYQ